MCVGYSGGGTSSRLTVVVGMASGSPWTGVDTLRTGDADLRF